MLDLDRPPKWGLVAIVFLVMSNILLLVLLLQRDDESTGGTAAATRSARATSSTMSSPSSTPAAATSSVDPTPDVLAVYGDGYSSGNSEGGLGAAGWPALVAEELGMQLDLDAATLAGYAVQGSTGQTFEQLVQADPVADATVTVVFGSRNDVTVAPAQVQEAAADTFAAVRAADPDTKLLVIGPSWSSADAPASLTAVSAAVQQAAESVGATYVDPLALGWFADPAGLVSPIDGISLLDPGHTYLADLIAPLVNAERTG